MPARRRAPGTTFVPSTVELHLPDGTRVDVHAFPATEAFVDDIRRSWDEVGGRAAEVPAAAMRLQGVLRRWYPRASVQIRDPMARLWGEDVVWYAFRDGRAPREDRLDDLHLALHRARQALEENSEARRTADAVLSEAQRARPAHRPAEAPR